jgi:SAM-dependent methyltransferase
MTCRICKAETKTILDLGASPPANSLNNSPEDEQESFPLVLESCQTCGNAQLRDCMDSEALYRNYLYLTPSSSMLSVHYENFYAYLAAGGYIRPGSFVLEVGSNNGRFLQYLKPKVGKVLGIDPATQICSLARTAGIDTLCDFFNSASAQSIRAEHGVPDLIVARHCLAHNCDPHVMIRAARELLGDTGHLVIENAYFLNTIENNEFDQIYHEHMFYFSIRSMQALLALNGLYLADVLMSPVHGGSIVFVAKKGGEGGKASDFVDRHCGHEKLFLTAAAFERFSENAKQIRTRLAVLVKGLTADGKSIFTYGASAKGNALLNYAGLTREQIRYCVDSTPIKQGKYLPKSQIQVVSEEYAGANPPDYFLLTAWNYQDEIIAKVRKSGNTHSKFIVPIPYVHIVAE